MHTLPVAYAVACKVLSDHDCNAEDKIVTVVSWMLQTALQAVATGGKVVQVGLGQDTCCAPTMQTVFKAINFTGSWLYTNTVSSRLHTAVPCLLQFDWSCLTISDSRGQFLVAVHVCAR